MISFRRPRTRKKGLVLSAILLGGILVAEGFLRIIPVSMWIRTTVTPPIHLQRVENGPIFLPSPWFHFYHPSEEDFTPFLADRRLVWRLKFSFRSNPDKPLIIPVPSLQTNRLGFRSPEMADERAPGCIRVACMGDSSTFGMGMTVHGEASYPRRLESLLNLCFPSQPFEVLNAGVVGYSSQQALVQWDLRVSRLHPQLVTLAFGTNDAWQGYGTDAEAMTYFDCWKGGAISWILNKEISRVFVWSVFSVAKHLAGINLLEPDAGIPRTARVSLEDFGTNLKTLVRRIRDSGAKGVLLNLMFSCESCGPYSEALKAVAEEFQYPYFDGVTFLAEVGKKWPPPSIVTPTLQVLEKTPELEALSATGLMDDPYHPSAFGHYLLSLGLFEACAPELRTLLDKGEK